MAIARSPMNCPRVARVEPERHTVAGGVPIRLTVQRLSFVRNVPLDGDARFVYARRMSKFRLSSMPPNRQTVLVGRKPLLPVWRAAILRYRPLKRNKQELAGNELLHRRYTDQNPAVFDPHWKVRRLLRTVRRAGVNLERQPCSGQTSTSPSSAFDLLPVKWTKFDRVVLPSRLHRRLSAIGFQQAPPEATSSGTTREIRHRSLTGKEPTGPRHSTIRSSIAMGIRGKERKCLWPCGGAGGGISAVGLRKGGGKPSTTLMKGPQRWPQSIQSHPGIRFSSDDFVSEKPSSECDANEH